MSGLLGESSNEPSPNSVPDRFVNAVRRSRVGRKEIDDQQVDPIRQLSARLAGERVDGVVDVLISRRDDFDHSHDVAVRMADGDAVGLVGVSPRLRCGRCA